MWLVLGLIGCEAGPKVTVTEYAVNEEVQSAFEPLEGYWEVQPTFASDCPSEWQRTMPMGQTHWQVQQGSLTITAARSSMSPLQLSPTDERTLERESVISAYGCQVTEALTLVIDTMSPYASEGLFSARLSHDGSPVCQELAAKAGLPSQCETIIDWRARRGSPF